MGRDIQFPLYADDTQLYIHLTYKKITEAFYRLKKCLDDIKKWLSANKLKLNPDKTECILFDSRTVCAKLSEFFPVNILGNLLSPAEVVRNLFVWFDSDFPSLAMSGIPVRPVLVILGILSDSEGTSCVILLSWLQTL